MPRVFFGSEKIRMVKLPGQGPPSPGTGTKKQKVVFTCWASDVGRGNVGANNFKNKALNVLICDSFDVPISDLKF